MQKTDRADLISATARRAAAGACDAPTLHRLIVSGIPRELYGTTPAERVRMTRPKPPPAGRPWDALIAAVVEHCADLLRFEKPAWTDDPERYLDRPWIGGPGTRTWTESLHAVPAAFLRHGVFIDPRRLDARGGETCVWTPLGR